MWKFAPPAPSEKVNFNDENIIKIENNIEMLVLHTGDEDIFPSFNEYTINRCTLSETPCGGMKYSITPDMKPGTISVDGEGCYLQNVACTDIKKVISAGKLAENKEISTAGIGGISYCSSDGIEYCAVNNDTYVITPPYTIASEFNVINVTNDTKTCTINIRCPDEVSSISLYNIDTLQYETTIFTNIKQSYGTVNSYSFTRTILPRTTEHLQIMVTYVNLTHTFKFSNDSNKSYGIHNLDSWLAYYNIDSNEINFITFNKKLEELVCVQNDNGIITSLTIKCNNCIAKHGKIIYSDTDTNIKTSTQFVDCFNQEMPGSLIKFLSTIDSVNESNTSGIITYVIPAISDTKILPNSQISESLISNFISIRACPTEYTCASFIIQSEGDIEVNFETSDLTYGSNTIQKNNINLKYVELWYQAGFDSKNTHKFGHYYTPELLVNDPKLIKTNCDNWEYYDISNPCGKNQLKLNNGKYIDINAISPSTTDFYKPTITERPVYDANYLQPVHLIKNQNRQVWITLHIPEGTVVGTYTGTIKIKVGSYVLDTINLSIEVLPIVLLPSSKKYSIYYRSRLADTGTISSEEKNIEQYEAELADMAKHGITCPSCYQVPSSTYLATVLELRHQYFPTCTDLYMFGRVIKNITTSDISTLINTGALYGISKVFIYGYDETDMNTTEIRAQIQTVHNNNAYVYCAQSPTYALSVKDVLDLAIGSSSFTASQISDFKASGHTIYSYGNPQTVIEYAETMRRNYGLYLWQVGYDGAMPYALQHSFQDIYSDFDDDMYRDHCMTYPTANGVIDTIQWEGFREGVNDIRYMTTLESAIISHPGDLANTINTWLNTLKTLDLTTQNLYMIRNQIINYILQLQGV